MNKETIETYMSAAYRLAKQSSDSSCQNGAIILLNETLLGTGYNEFPPGVQFDLIKATQRPEKYIYYEHAERAAIYHCAKYGNGTMDGIMICPWACCCDCARSIICAGIRKVIVHAERMDVTRDFWQENIKIAWGMLTEAKVKVELYRGPVGVKPIRVNGKLWSPDTCDFVEKENDSDICR
jgi:dCMP deaminase